MEEAKEKKVTFREVNRKNQSKEKGGWCLDTAETNESLLSLNDTSDYDLLNAYSVPILSNHFSISLSLPFLLIGSTHLIGTIIRSTLWKGSQGSERFSN